MLPSGRLKSSFAFSIRRPPAAVGELGRKTVPDEISRSVLQD